MIVVKISCAIVKVLSLSTMSEEQFKAFIARVKEDKAIQEKLKTAKTPEEVVEIAKEHGHEFSADKITKLSEEELETVAGGVACANPGPLGMGSC